MEVTQEYWLAGRRILLGNLHTGSPGRFGPAVGEGRSASLRLRTRVPMHNRIGDLPGAVGGDVAVSAEIRRVYPEPVESPQEPPPGNR